MTRIPLSEVGPLPFTRTAVCPNPGKLLYRSKKHAKKAIATIRLQGRDRVHPYKCVCGCWHIGHKQGSRKNHNSQPRA